MCNIAYEVITKALANRRKSVLPASTSPERSAFVPGRLLTDNVLIAFEVLHLIRRKTSGREGLMGLKLDMSKAYDRAEWLFFINIM